MKVVAVVPMKLTNRRLPEKNTKRLTKGRPLCEYAISTAVDTKGIDEVYVFCSDESIQDYMPEHVKYLKRDSSLDKDTTSMNEVLQSFATEVKADIYVLIHATAPFITSESIEKGLDAITKNGYDSSFSVMRVQDFIWDEYKPLNYELNDIPRTQDLPTLFKETSGFYAFKREVLMNYQRRIGFRPFMVEVGGIEAIDIDEEEDFMMADAINYFRMSVIDGGVSRRYSALTKGSLYATFSMGVAA